MNGFEKLNDWIHNTESSIVNFLSVFAPWLAPLTPAYMTYQHATSILHFPSSIALPAAILVEILGFSAVSTFLSFWFYNKKNQASYKRAPIEVIIFAFMFYLALIVFSNVLLDSFPSERWAEITVRALFTLQTIPADLIFAVRTQHKDLLSEISRERQQKLTERYRKSSESNQEEQKVSENLPKDWRKLRPTLSESDVANIASMNSLQVKEFSKKYEIDMRTVTNWRTYARKEVGMEDTNN
jgi:DNA-binding transcriptional regulator YiaG